MSVGGFPSIVSIQYRSFDAIHLTRPSDSCVCSCVWLVDHSPALCVAGSLAAGSLCVARAGAPPPLHPLARARFQFLSVGSAPKEPQTPEKWAEMGILAGFSLLRGTLWAF